MDTAAIIENENFDTHGFENFIDLSGDAWISGDGSGQTAVRGGGSGGNASVQRLTDIRPGFLDWQFVELDTSDLSRSGRSGTISWEGLGDGVYALNRLCTGTRSEGSFIVIIHDGQVAEVSHTRQQLVEILSPITDGRKRAVLRGDETPRQKAWARQIREQLIARAEDADLDESVVERLLALSSATWLIDNRNRDADALRQRFAA